MKCTLRKVDGGVAATIDQPKAGLILCDKYSIGDILTEVEVKYIKEHKLKNLFSVIASTIPNVGKELCIIEDGEIVQIDLYQGSRYTIAEFIESINGTKQYDYTETETQIIIEL